MTTAEEQRWYWCKAHERVEPADDVCRALDRLGPYESPEAARNWKQRVEERNQAWEEQDDEWDSWPDEAQTDG